MQLGYCHIYRTSIPSSAGNDHSDGEAESDTTSFLLHKGSVAEAIRAQSMYAKITELCYIITQLEQLQIIFENRTLLL